MNKRKTIKKLIEILLFIPKEFIKDYFPKKEEIKPFYRLRATDILINGCINEVDEFYEDEVYL